MSSKFAWKTPLLFLLHWWRSVLSECCFLLIHVPLINIDCNLWCDHYVDVWHAYFQSMALGTGCRLCKDIKGTYHLTLMPCHIHFLKLARWTQSANIRWKQSHFHKSVTHYKSDWHCISPWCFSRAFTYASYNYANALSNGSNHASFTPWNWAGHSNFLANGHEETVYLHLAWNPYGNVWSPRKCFNSTHSLPVLRLSCLAPSSFLANA